MSQEENLTLVLTVEEVNVILDALGALPFNQVYGIITKLHQQANHQLEDDSLSQPEES